MVTAWTAQVQRESERQTVWEEGLQAVLRKGEVLERELRIRMRKWGSMFFDDVGANDSTGTLRVSTAPRNGRIDFFFCH